MDEGLKKILDKIDGETTEEENRIINEAESQANEIIKSAEDEANKEAEKIIKHYEEKTKRTENMVHASTRLGEKMKRLSHVNKQGEARMVDVSAKASTARKAVARARIRMKPATLRQIRQNEMDKGDVLSVARTAGIMVEGWMTRAP